IAILLKRNRKASNVARMVWRPRNGEKAIKTPIEKASAVRSGGSSIASRRRNAARNITLCNLCVLCVSVVVVTFHHRDTEDTEVAQRRKLLKTLQSFRFVIVRIENGQQLRNHQQVPNPLR